MTAVLALPAIALIARGPVTGVITAGPRGIRRGRAPSAGRRPAGSPPPERRARRDPGPQLARPAVTAGTPPRRTLAGPHGAARRNRRRKTS